MRRDLQQEYSLAPPQKNKAIPIIRRHNYWKKGWMISAKVTQIGAAPIKWRDIPIQEEVGTHYQVG